MHLRYDSGRRRLGRPAASSETLLIGNSRAAPNTIADDDIELREAESILADYIELLPKAPAERTVIASAPSDRKHFAASQQKSILSIANTER